MSSNNINTDAAQKTTTPVVSPMSLRDGENTAAVKGEPTPSPAVKPVEKKDPAVSAEQAKQLTDELNTYMNDLQTNLGFSFREDLKNQIIVEIKNRQTDDIVKQIPTEELLQIKEKMIELTGLLFDQKV